MYSASACAQIVVLKVSKTNKYWNVKPQVFWTFFSFSDIIVLFCEQSVGQLVNTLIQLAEVHKNSPSESLAGKDFVNGDIKNNKCAVDKFRTKCNAQ